MRADPQRLVPGLIVALLVGLGSPWAAHARKPGEGPLIPVDGPPPTRLRHRDIMLVELGAYAGVFMPSREHELFVPDPEVVDQGFLPLRPVGPAIGLRLGYYWPSRWPVRWLGIEAEGGVMPTRLRDRADEALLYTARAQLVARLTHRRVVPFLLVGGGVIGIESKPEVLGRDLDAALHFGGGIELFIVREVGLRLDVRDVVSWRRGTEPSFGAHGFEATLGLTLRFAIRPR